jgi:hypothetical protein
MQGLSVSTFKQLVFSTNSGCCTLVYQSVMRRMFENYASDGAVPRFE